MQSRFGEAREVDGLPLYTELGKVNDCAPIYASVGKAYFDAGEYHKAEEALKKPLSIYDKRRNANQAISTICTYVSTISECA